MKRTTRLAALALAGLLLASGCAAKHHAAASITAPTGPTTSGTFVSMVVDGVPWTSNVANQSPNGELTELGLRFLSAYATDGQGHLSWVFITLNGINAPGTYPLGVGVLTYGGSVQFYEGTSAWTTPLSGEAGTLTVTTLTATRIAGTFECVLDSAAAAPIARRHVTSGTFDFPITATVPQVVPNIYSSVHMSLDDVAWTASTVAPQGLPHGYGWSEPLFTAGNLASDLSVAVVNWHGVGHYPLRGSTAGDTLAIVTYWTPENPMVWGDNSAGDTGELVITRVTGTRAEGTLNATLAPYLGTTTTRHIVDCTFDIPAGSATGPATATGRANGRTGDRPMVLALRPAIAAPRAPMATR